VERTGRRVGLGLTGRGDVRDAVEYARRAQRLGFESVWVHETYFERDSVTYLTAMAQDVPNIRLGAGALNPYTRHAVVLAMTMSSLDDLAPGRIALALGSALPLRLQQMGIQYDDTVAEVSRTIDLLRTLWAGERLSLNPNVPDFQAMYRPPHRIPIFIAGYQGRFLDLTGEKADGYLARPAESIPALRLMRKRVARSAREHGRDPEAIESAGYVLSLVGPTRREALNRAKREPFVIYMMGILSDISLKRAGFPPELRNEIAAAWRAEDFHRAGQLIPDELLDAFLACGTREEVALKAHEYHEAGLDVPLLQPILQEEDEVQAVLEAGQLYATGSVGAPVESTSVPGAAPVWQNQKISPLRRIQAWYEISRPFSLTASLIPILTGGALAWANHRFVLWLFLLALVGGVSLQAATNVINEIYDVRHGIDKITSPRASHALLKGALSERGAFILAAAQFALTAATGVVLILVHGWIMLAIGLVGLVAGYSYTGPPFHYKYRALGVPLVFFLMGPLEVVGTYYAITGRYTNTALVASLPIGLLVAAILHANEWRDISEDARTGFSTLSAEIGSRRAHYVYVALVTGAYLTTGLAVLTHLLPLAALLALLSLPVFVVVLRDSELGASGQARALSMIDLDTARLHLTFGLLLATGLVVGRYVS